MYYLVTSAKNKDILATKVITECYDFIVKNKDAKIRELDYSSNTKVIDRRMFIMDFYRLSEDEDKTFQLAEIMIKGGSNLNSFLVNNGLKANYFLYKQATKNTL